MASWAQRMHRRAADLGSVVTSCGHPGPGPYPHRLEKVKFGVPLDEVCKNDIPGPLLVLILKLNKEAPQRKDVFRAPGHQGAMKKLIHFLQAGRLVNVDNYSVYTIASVLKKFLRKIPNGIFGRDGEAELFAIVELDNNEFEQQERIHRLITSLPVYTQRLLVLLFGTFRVIASNADRAGTGMTSEALGVSVAPSFFQSCVSDGKTARMEDVLRFKVATKIMKQMIDQFATYDLFGRDNYEFYARVTGRILKVQDEWICSFRYPPPPRGKSAQQSYAVQLSLEAEKTWLQCECERWGLIAQEESQSTPALLTSSSSAIGNSALSLGIIPEHSLLESCARLSVSLEGPGVFAITATASSSQTAGNISGSSNNGIGGIGVGGCGGSNGIKTSSSCSSTRSSKSASAASHHMTMDELRAVNRYAESTKSLSYLPQVHERQTARMRTRSEWFLGARGGSLELAAACENYHQFFGGSTNDIEQHQHLHHPGLTNNAMLLMLQQHHHMQQQQYHHHLQRMDTDMSADEHEIGLGNAMMMETNFPPMSVGNIGLSASAESVHYQVKRSSRRGPSAARHHPHRSSSRRNKENGKGPTSTPTTVVTTVADTPTTVGGPSINSNNLAPSSAVTVVVTGISGNGGSSSTGQQRSNSFRQRKSSSLMSDCGSISSNSKMRKPRAVSFESTHQPSHQQQSQQLQIQQHQQQLLKTLPQQMTNLMAIVKTSTSNNDSIHEDCDILMVDTIQSPSIGSNSSIPPSVVQEKQQSSQLHFKPPRV